jgi:hypothetical protein
VTIQSLAAFCRALWDWACLKGCFPRDISPTDIDGLVEIKGRFLMFEAKGPGKGVAAGQRYTLNAVAALPEWTVIVVWGDPGQPRSMAVWPQAPVPADIDLFRAVVKQWADWADAGPPPKERFAWSPWKPGEPPPFMACAPGCACDFCTEWGLK